MAALTRGPKTFRGGCIAGGLFVICIIIVGLIFADGIADETDAGTLGIWLMIAIGLVGGVTGIVLAVRPSTRRAGMGILVVVVIGPLITAVLFVVLLLIAFSQNSYT